MRAGQHKSDYIYETGWGGSINQGRGSSMNEEDVAIVPWTGGESGKRKKITDTTNEMTSEGDESKEIHKIWFQTNAVCIAYVTHSSFPHPMHQSQHCTGRRNIYYKKRNKDK